MRSLYRAGMQRGTVLNEKLLQFPVGSFPGSHAELPLRAEPSPSAGLGRQQSSGERGCAWPPAPPAAGTSPGRAPLPLCPCSTSASSTASIVPGQPRTLPAGAISLPPRCTPYYNAALTEEKKRKKKVDQFLIMPCLLSFRANSAHTKVILHIKRNIY